MRYIKTTILLGAIATATITMIPVAVQAQDFDPTGRWQCFTGQSPTPDRSSQGYKSSTIESVVNANPDGTFQAQGLQHGSVNSVQFVAEGSWNVRQVNQGISVDFEGQSQSSFMGMPQTMPFLAGGIVRNANYLSYSEINSIAEISFICSRLN